MPSFPKNDDINQISNRIQLKIPSTVTEYKSIDTVIKEDDAVNYSIESFNSLEPSGILSHKLAMKSGSPILLLRNLKAPKLCNRIRFC